MPDDLPPAVAERMRNRLAAFRPGLDTESPRFGFRWIRRLRQRRLIGWPTAAVATAVLLVAVLWISQAWHSAESLAWAEVVEAVAKRPWLHYVETWQDGTRLEGWYSVRGSVEGRHYMPSGTDHGLETYTWTNFAQQTETCYSPQVNRILRGNQSPEHRQSRKFFSAAWRSAFLSGQVGGPIRAGGYEIVDQKQRMVTEGGKPAIEYRFRWRQTATDTRSVTQFLVMVDPETRLPFRLDLIDQGKEPRPFERMDYPAHGPADLFAMGVPKTAESINCALPPEVERLAKTTVAAACRENTEFSALVVDSLYGHHSGYRVWKKGARWRIDAAIGPLARPSDQVPSNEADLAGWWRQKAEKGTFTPQALFDGQWQWKYTTKTRRSNAAEIKAGADKKAEVLVSSTKEKLLPWLKDRYWEERPLSWMGRPTTLSDSPPAGLPIYDSDYGAPCQAALDAKPKEGPPNAVMLELRDPVWKLDDSKHRRWSFPQTVRVWIDPTRDYLLVRSDDLISREGKEEMIGGFRIDGFAQDPQKRWFPTVVHQLTHILPPDGHGGLDDIEMRFYYDFTTPVPDSLFKAE
jgi:hypothetical protein